MNADEVREIVREAIRDERIRIGRAARDAADRWTHHAQTGIPGLDTTWTEAPGQALLEFARELEVIQ